MAPNPTQFSTSFKCSRMLIRAEYSSVAVTGEKEGPLALRRGYITPNVPTVSYRLTIGWSDRGSSCREADGGDGLDANQS
jgi:hypothetical protein